MTRPQLDQCGLIAVLHQKVETPRPPDAAYLQRIMAAYTSAQQALWADDDATFVESLNSLIGIINNDVEDAERRDTATFLAIGLLEAGMSQELETSNIAIEQLSERTPDQLKQLVEFAKDEVRREKRKKRRDVEPVTRERLEASPRELETLPERTKRLVQDQPDDNMRIRGAVQREQDSLVIRLTTTERGSNALRELRPFVEQLVAGLRGQTFASPLSWRPEYVSLDDRRLQLGVSWDAFPYPNVGRNLPGFTAWIANDGRAEIIVRFPPRT